MAQGTKPSKRKNDIDSLRYGIDQKRQGKKINHKIVTKKVEELNRILSSYAKIGKDY